MSAFHNEAIRMAQCALDEYRFNYAAARLHLYRRLKDVVAADDLEKRLERQIIAAAVEHLDKHHRPGQPVAAADGGFAV